jgi:hypothetical protein
MAGWLGLSERDSPECSMQHEDSSFDGAGPTGARQTEPVASTGNEPSN